ncbi:unnamed protein product [Bursaphelenchus okinawaensis]|uniref:Endoplasmic reticulum transmembrane protein n=1 Tax=Bursaphelenchus okinawaensis TaxID=465554 RepID=A0A811KTR9_9BILA|nr:unnamed protein product [Bursaphelenchus okinawaensis]CAG9111445.1 unnamed protein product [Bursaphelenchus okinawaensis]
MTLQWTVVAGILYLEIGVVLLLLLPWIRPTHWKKLFHSRLASSISRFASVYFYAVVAVLMLLLLDAVREVRKYSDVDINTEVRRALESDAMIHMRLFRSQRNLYISGFALLLFVVINRLVTLISRTAALQASADAALKQAQSANQAAKTLMEAGDGDALQESTKEVEDLKKKLRQAEQDRDAMKKQSENLQEEYERVSDLLSKKEAAGGDKKSN